MDIVKTLAFSAVGGMVAGIAGCGPDKPASEPSGDSTATPADTSTAATTSDAKTCCKGKNECKGKGGCKTTGEGAHECAGKNDCTGKGGCSKREC
jgi:hypothetical protein